MEPLLQNYEVKHLGLGGCVPATREGVEELNYRYLLRCSLRSASHK